MMDILMYLFETYIQGDAELYLNQDELEEELLRAGFYQEDIYKALIWLEELATLPQSEFPLVLRTDSVTSMRIYTQHEQALLNMECRGFLLFLEQIKILTVKIREMVIDRVMGLDTNDFELEDLKWVILMVLFNVPGNENAYAEMENLVYMTEPHLFH